MTNSLRTLLAIAAAGLVAAVPWFACNNSSTSSPSGDAGASGLGSSSSSGSSSGGSGSGSPGGSSGSSSAEVGDGAAPLTCASYCALIQTACTGPTQQYATMDECMTACQYIPVDDQGSGNTLLCHYDHALNALAVDAGGYGLGANPHCWHAGPYGWGVCGTQCEDFCAIVTSYCTPDGGFAPESGTPPYASSADCLTSCPGFAGIADSGSAVVIVDGSPNTSSYSSAGPFSGNTLDCREYHLGAALQSTMLQQMHCNHPGANSPTCLP